MSILLLLTVASGHDGVVRTRNMPESSDIALFVVAVLAVGLVRRALRRRFARTGRLAKKD